MKSYIFDLEGDGLVPTKIWCLVVNTGDKIIQLTSYSEMRKILLEADELIGHNIIRFDIPKAVEKILGIKIKARLIDTLALSWYLEPKRLIHGLESYGEEFGVPKPEITDWQNLSIEEYVHRCTEDVKINTLLYNKQKTKLQRLYDNNNDSDRLIRYLSFKMDCARVQEEVGWKLDVDKCNNVLKKLVILRDEKISELTKSMPKVPIIVKKSRPKKPYKKDGTYSTIGAIWFSLLRERGLSENFDGEIEIINGYEEPNPSSHIQIKNWLFSLGWEPQTFKFVRNKETNEIRKIPQVSNEKKDGVCDSIKALFEIEPSLELLDGLGILEHRISILEGFLRDVDENGKVKAEIQGFTNTLRFKHKTVVNLPKVGVPYGEEIRSCLISDGDYITCGADMSSLEDRTKQHYMYKYDPDYVNEMRKPGFDPHLDLAVLGKFMTQKDADDYKSGNEKPYKAIRHNAKTTNYACTYGARPPRIAMTAKISIEEATKLFNAYWKRNWSIEKIAEDCIVKNLDDEMWLYNPVSRFWYSLRTDKDRFSTLNQGTGVYAFDTWIKYVRKEKSKMTAQFHDEGVWVILKKDKERLKELLLRAIQRTNEELKLNIKLDIDVKFGENYAAVH